MNKHIIWLFTLLVFVLAGCEKDEIGNTATEALAGEWKVTVDAVDEGGNVIAEDFNGTFVLSSSISIGLGFKSKHLGFKS